MDQYRMIDGKDFANFVSGFMSFITKTFRYLVDSIREYFPITTLVFILILGTGLLYRHNSKPYYESVMVCSFREMNKKTYGEMIHKLDVLAKDRSYNALSKMLNMPVEDAAYVISIEGKNRAGSMLFEDITDDKLPVYIEVKTANAKVFPALETALVNYLNTSSPYVRSKTTADSIEVNTKLEVLNKNIRIVDSVIATIHHLLKVSTPFSDTSITSDKFASLIKYKAGLENEVVMQQKRKNELGKSVEILHGFSPSEKPTSNKDKIFRLFIVASIIASCGSAVLRKAVHDEKKILSL